MLTNGIIAYFIPDVPTKIKKTLEYEMNIDMDAKLQVMNDEARSARKHQSSPKLKIKRN